jgi:adhesin/invasin
MPLVTVACQKVPLLAPTGSTIILTASANALPTNATADLTAQVLQAGGNPPHSGTLITFTTTLGGIEPSEARTDVSGRVIVKFSSGLANGTATIVASSGGATTGTTGAAKIAIGTAALGRVSVSANPLYVPSTGGSSTITAAVFDINGNALRSVAVSFTATAGALSAAIATTGADGVAATILTTSQPSTVTASVGATAPAAPTAGGTAPTTPAPACAPCSVTVNPKPQPVVSVASSATTTPTAGTDTTFTATVTPAANSGTVIQDATINYGDGNRTPLGPVTGTGFALHHVYQNSGTYTVVLTATDSNGGVGTAVTTVFVQAATPLTVLLSATATPAGTSTVETFTATVIGLGNAVVVNYHWVFGSTLGTADTTGNQVTRTYPPGAGTITVTVTITTSTGATQSGQTVIVVP